MLDTDLFFGMGPVLPVFSVPLIIGATTECRPPRTAAVHEKPNPYPLATIPDAFARAVGRYVK